VALDAFARVFPTILSTRRVGVAFYLARFCCFFVDSREPVSQLFSRYFWDLGLRAYP